MCTCLCTLGLGLQAAVGGSWPWSTLAFSAAAPGLQQLHKQALVDSGSSFTCLQHMGSSQTRINWEALRSSLGHWSQRNQSLGSRPVLMAGFLPSPVSCLVPMNTHWASERLLKWRPSYSYSVGPNPLITSSWAISVPPPAHPGPASDPVLTCPTVPLGNCKLLLMCVPSPTCQWTPQWGTRQVPAFPQ